MDIKLNKVSNFKLGILFNLLTDAYSFDENIIDACIAKLRENDSFFFNDLQIANKCGYITTLEDEVIGFINWDPRNMPEYAIIGDNCIISKHKGKGYGKLQLKKAINRIARNDVKKIFVSTIYKARCFNVRTVADITKHGDILQHGYMR
jgi:predicted acetyltransferase